MDLNVANDSSVPGQLPSEQLPETLQVNVEVQEESVYVNMLPDTTTTAGEALSKAVPSTEPSTVAQPGASLPASGPPSTICPRSASAAACRRFLLETSLSQLKTPQHLVILRDTATVEQALKTLARHKILAAPVVLTSESAASDAQWPCEFGASDILGFADIRDVLSSFLQDIKVEELIRMKLLQRMRLLEERGQLFAASQIKDLKQLGGDGDFLHITQAKVSLMELVLYGLLDPKRRAMHAGEYVNEVVHRVALFDAAGRITHIISQTDIIRFLLRNSDKLGDIIKLTVENLGFVGKKVEAVHPEMSALEAMNLMNKKKISSLVVVDGNKKVIGNFSISDMRTIMAEHFGALSLPVGEFLALEHGTEFLGYARVLDEEVVGSAGHRFVTDRVSRARPRTPGEEVGQRMILCTPDWTLLQVMEALVNNRIHRLYVIDSEDRPTGIITCTDILRKVVEVCQ